MMRSGLHRLLIVLLTLCAGCASLTLTPPLSPLPPEQHPALADDLSRESLQLALAQSLQALDRQPPPESTGTDAKTRAAVVAALRRFQQILAENPAPSELYAVITQEFDIYQAAARPATSWDQRMLVTGYYEPLFDARLERAAPFIHPLYGPPDDLVIRKEGGSQANAIGRLQQGQLVPYWTRTEIETQGKARGKEIAWLQDPVDVFVLQIQGSGRLRLADGSVRGVHYAARNGRPYRSIGKYLVEQNRMSLDNASMPRIRDYLAAHPQERDSILRHNESFVFFRLDERLGAIGSLGRPLTTGRSVATDAAFYPPGALAALISRQPVLSQRQLSDWKPLSRFVLLQDSGSAIKGPGRLDLFFGSGPEAEIAAGNMRENGKLYIFFLKRHPPGPQFRPAGSPMAEDQASGPRVPCRG
ncbi:MAG: hypothetical protein BWK76_19425 [Desulfobulbaceae bacterium A2]|nr:MAG: hypothetical protein BWK76_19425 [Desulfobulbaceae bacterium A2]